MRVFQKEARTAAAAGHEVHILAPGTPPADRDGVRFHELPEGVGVTSALFWKVLRHYPAILRAAREVDADVYHLPDPILIPAALLLRRRGARIVYDAHEDRPRQALTKYRSAGRPVVALISAPLWAALEAVGRRYIDRFVAATPAIAARFPCARTVTVHNYPVRAEFPHEPAADRPNVVVYLGSLKPQRNIRELVEAIGLLPPGLDARLLLIGSFSRSRPDFRPRLEGMAGWARVECCRHLPREELAERLRETRVGLNVLAPSPEYSVALGNKLFEYMAAGLPQICSDFPLMRELVHDPGLGLTVDPSDPAAIAASIRSLLEHPAEADAMGRRARAAVDERYNWESQEAGLLKLYEGLEEQESAIPRALGLSGLRP